MWSETGVRIERKEGHSAIVHQEGDEVDFRWHFHTNSVLQLEAPVLKRIKAAFPEGTASE